LGYKGIYIGSFKIQEIRGFWNWIGVFWILDFFGVYDLNINYMLYIEQYDIAYARIGEAMEGEKSSKGTRTRT